MDSSVGSAPLAEDGQRSRRAALDALLRPRTVCVVGVSAKRPTRGNIAIQSMKAWGFAGRILPVHPQATELEGLPVVAAIEELPPGVDVAFVAVPAANVCDVIARLDRVGVRAAVVITAGFSVAEEAELRALAASAAILVHGPNCMGVLNLTDAVQLYSAEVSAKVTPGKVALLAQSGSAAIAVMNTLGVGFSKVATLGSEYRVTAVDYLDWLADDPATSVIGVILEAIQSPKAFAAAVRRAHSAGKSVVVLKVGRSAVGGLAAQAHTGAMISPATAYDRYFADLGVPCVSDYDQLAAALTALSICAAPAPGTGVAVVGISGGETALACDLASDLGLRLATWSPETETVVRQALPGTTGRNPLDVGASVGREGTGGDLVAMTAIAADPAVGMVICLQDMQASLPRQLVQKYQTPVGVQAALRRATNKPLLMISPTPDPLHDALTAPLAEVGVPLIRGLWAGLAAARALTVVGDRGGTKARVDDDAAPGVPPETLSALKAEIRRHVGALPGPLCQRILALYGVPFVRSVMVGPDDALPGPDKFSYPVVVKIASADVTHRSDVGGVVLDVADHAMLVDAIATIRSRVAAAVPDAIIDGFEIQEQMTDCVEALVGFTAAPPFDPMTIVGSGGTLAELQADRSVALGLIGPSRAAAMIADTRLGKLLDGYRNLTPRTSPEGLATVVSRLSRLAIDLADVLVECDLNPVLVAKGSGAAKAVDVLMIASPL